MNDSDPPASQSRPDPLIDEVRELRRALSAKFGDDIRKLGEHLRQTQSRYGKRLVQPPNMPSDLHDRAKPA